MINRPAMRPLILGIGGTPRPASTTEMAVRAALAAAEAAGAESMLISGPELMLPMYFPGGAERSPEIVRLVEAFRRCDGLIVGSPAYHGSISGMMKNALDYVEDLRDEGRVYFDGVAVGLIVCAGGWQAAGQTLATLRGIVHALRGWPTPLGAAINTSSPVFDEAGTCIELSTKMQLETVGRQVVEFARMRKHVHAFETQA
jgi:FMN reductase